MGAVPAEAAPSAARSRHGAVAAAVPLRRHPLTPRRAAPPGRRARRGLRGAVGGCATPTAPRRLLTAPGRAGRDHGVGSSEPCGTVRGWSTGLPPAGGRSRPVRHRPAAPPSGKAGATPPMYSPPHACYVGSSPRDSAHTCGAERSTPKRAGGGGGAETAVSTASVCNTSEFRFMQDLHSPVRTPHPLPGRESPSRLLPPPAAPHDRHRASATTWRRRPSRARLRRYPVRLRGTSPEGGEKMAEAE